MVAGLVAETVVEVNGVVAVAVVVEEVVLFDSFLLAWLSCTPPIALVVVDTSDDGISLVVVVSSGSLVAVMVVVVSFGLGGSSSVDAVSLSVAPDGYWCCCGYM